MKTYIQYGFNLYTWRFYLYLRHHLPNLLRQLR